MPIDRAIAIQDRLTLLIPLLDSAGYYEIKLAQQELRGTLANLTDLIVLMRKREQGLRSED